MDFAESPQDSAFRAEVRAWLEANAPEPAPAQREQVTLFSEGGDETETVAQARRWQRVLADGGLAAIHWPPEYGGKGASLVQTMILQEELLRYDVPQRVCGLGIGLLGPTLVAHGTEEQKLRYLPPMLRGDEIWCQLWSEPGAGSDLSSLGSRADGNDGPGGGWILNGQKVWTSGAHYSELALGIFRTDWDAPKHRGISCFVVDMKAPGIDVRPLRQMTGGANFNEVFFDNVHVAADNLVGDLHDGWRVARTTLMNERMAAGTTASPATSFPALARLAASVGVDRNLRQDLARVYSLGRIFDLTNGRVRSSLSRGAIPGPESSILKLAVSQILTEQADIAMRVLAAGGMLADGDAPEDGRWQAAFLGAPAVHIGGGTDEIQRNLIGEAVLGLPREPAVDRDRNFRDIMSGEA